MLEISDTGCGMDAETQKRIFDPFFTTKFTGRGLGMSAMLGIVQSHQGALHIDSRPDQGTRISIVFPVARQQGQNEQGQNKQGQYEQSPQSASSKPPVWQTTGTALVIDDDENVRELAAAILQDTGFDVLTANDGAQGLAVFRQHQDEIKLVLLDMSMPIMNGEKCFTELRRLQADIRILLSSGYNEQDSSDYLSGQKLSGFIQKPYSPDALIDKLQQVMSL